MKIAQARKKAILVSNSLEARTGPNPSLVPWVWKATCLPKITYACQLWAHLDKSFKAWKNFRHLSRSCLTKVAPLHPNSPTAALEILTDSPPAELLVRRRGILNHLRLRHDHDNNLVATDGHIQRWEDYLSLNGIKAVKEDRRTRIFNWDPPFATDPGRLSLYTMTVYIANKKNLSSIAYELFQENKDTYHSLLAEAIPLGKLTSLHSYYGLLAGLSEILRQLDSLELRIRKGSCINVLCNRSINGVLKTEIFSHTAAAAISKAKELKLKYGITVNLPFKGRCGAKGRAKTKIPSIMGLPFQDLNGNVSLISSKDTDIFAEVDWDHTKGPSPQTPWRQSGIEQKRTENWNSVEKQEHGVLLDKLWVHRQPTSKNLAWDAVEKRPDDSDEDNFTPKRGGPRPPQSIMGTL